MAYGVGLFVTTARWLRESCIGIGPVLDWSVSVDSSVIRAHQHSATAKRFDPVDTVAGEGLASLPDDVGGDTE